MTTFTRAWDETIPAGSQDANLLDDDIRNFKTDIRERIAAIFGMNLTQFADDPMQLQGLDFSGGTIVVIAGPTTRVDWKNNAGTSTNMSLDDAGNLTIRGDFSAAGGRAQCVDGWSQATIPATQAATEPTRSAGRWVAPRAGSVLGVILQIGATTKATAGSLTATAWKSVVNTGTSAHTDSALTINAIVNTTNPCVSSTIQAKDIDTFNANDELFLKFATDGSWAPTTLTCRAALLVEF